MQTGMEEQQQKNGGLPEMQTAETGSSGSTAYKTVHTERVSVQKMDVRLVEQQPESVSDEEKTRIEDCLFQIFRKYRKRGIQT